MNLREPKRKRRVKLQPQLPFPIVVGGTDEWTVYTAHLTDLGSCIIDPTEIAAVHSMGFFGKGSLSRGYPSFGKPRYGAPPVVRNRQWVRRQQWLKEVKDLSAETLSDSGKSINWEQLYNGAADMEDPSKDAQKAEDIEKEQLEEQQQKNVPDVIEIYSDAGSLEKSKEVDEVTLDSAEEDDICLIVNREIEKYKSQSDIKPDEEENLKNKEIRELCNLDDDSENEKSFVENGDKNIEGKLLVLPDSDSETEDYLTNIKPRIECEGFPIRETLHLTFEETFFLLFGLGCLQLIHFDGSLLDINSAWLYFCKMDKNFIQKYVVYHYFRSKGWVVKPGLKYGGDFLLYKQGPPFYHASYIVIIDVVDADTLLRSHSKSMRKMTWNNLFGLERLSETAAKEVLFAQVLWPSSVSQNNCPPTPDVLSEFTVRELLWRRWNPKQNRDVIHLEDDDEDSC